MKMKSFAMLAVPGLLAISLAYTIPVMADDMNNGQSSMQAPTAPSDNSGQASSNVGSTNEMPSSGDNMNNNTNGSSTGTTDQGSPDTATGDDDY